jgi:hypothetical protein
MTVLNSECKQLVWRIVALAQVTELAAGFSMRSGLTSFFRQSLHYIWDRERRDPRRLGRVRPLRKSSRITTTTNRAGS